jgi:FixJ family two-component response regulator
MCKSGLQIAVVDDEESVRKALERLLRSAGMSAHTFPSGAEFISALPDLVADCVVLDLHMPRINGFEVLAHLTQIDRRLPVIIITGHDTPESRSRVRVNSVVAYLLKPVDDCKLLQAIDAAVAAGHQ